MILLSNVLVNQLLSAPMCDNMDLTDFWETPFNYLLQKLNSTYHNLACKRLLCLWSPQIVFFWLGAIFIMLQVSDLIDTVLECFLKRCAEVRFGSSVVEILADTAVALASANVRMVARIIISRLCSVRIYRLSISTVVSTFVSVLILFGTLRHSSKRVFHQLQPSNNTFCGVTSWFCPDICLCYRSTIVWMWRSICLTCSTLSHFSFTPDL